MHTFYKYLTDYLLRVEYSCFSKCRYEILYSIKNHFEDWHEIIRESTFLGEFDLTYYKAKWLQDRILLNCKKSLQIKHIDHIFAPNANEMVQKLAFQITVSTYVAFPKICIFLGMQCTMMNILGFLWCQLYGVKKSSLIFWWCSIKSSLKAAFHLTLPFQRLEKAWRMRCKDYFKAW